MWPLRSLRLAAPVALGSALVFCGLVALDVRWPLGERRTVMVQHALTLDIVNREAPCTYHSSFDVRPIYASESDTHIELQRTFENSDGCTWRSFETLDRAPGSTQLMYGYREAPYSCEPEATPAPACRREGVASE